MTKSQRNMTIAIVILVFALTAHAQESPPRAPTGLTIETIPYAPGEVILNWGKVVQRVNGDSLVVHHYNIYGDTLTTFLDSILEHSSYDTTAQFGLSEWLRFAPRVYLIVTAVDC